jgi:SAM-dependent methyltransferase
MSQNTPWRAPVRLFKVWSDTQKVLSLIRTHGIQAALAEVRSTTLYRLAALESRRFDRAYGVETNELVRVTDLTLRSSARGGPGPNYVPSLVWMLRLAIRQMPSDLSDYVFIDMGSGKGRVLLAAAQYKFKRVLGVEFAQELHEQAQRNIMAFRGPRQTPEILSVLSDARDFEIPNERCVVYIFGAAEYAELLEAVIRKLERSYLQVPRAIFVIVVNMEVGAVVEKFPIFRAMVGRGALAKLVLSRIGSLRMLATPEACVSRWA